VFGGVSGEVCADRNRRVFGMKCLMHPENRAFFGRGARPSKSKKYQMQVYVAVFYLPKLCTWYWNNDCPEKCHVNLMTLSCHVRYNWVMFLELPYGTRYTCSV
jgi:hypothetical protein